MKRRRKDRRRRAGAALVEAAIVLPLVLLFFFGIFEYGRYLMTQHLCNNAVRAGAAYAAKHTGAIVLDGTTYGNATSDVLNVVNSSLLGGQLNGQSVLVYLSDSQGNNLGNWSDAEAGQYVCVRISGTYQFTVPQLLFLPASVPVSFQAVKRSEGN
jgi:Flp pilus assembly protein TadG